MKTCSNCKAKKDFSDFNKQSSSGDGYASCCRKCRNEKRRKQYNSCPEIQDKCREAARKYRLENPDSVAITKRLCRQKKIEEYKSKEREYYQRNKEKIRKYGIKYRQDNNLRIRDRDNQYKRENRDRLNRAQIEYQRRTSEDRNRYSREYRKNRIRKDPVFALQQLYRRRLLFDLKKKSIKKGCKSEEMLGCSWDQFKGHIESQFSAGMNWGNRGEWHIDHIVPLASAKTIDDVRRLSHYTNLQPLWAKENLSKGAKLPEELSK